MRLDPAAIKVIQSTGGYGGGATLRQSGVSHSGSGGAATFEALLKEASKTDSTKDAEQRLREAARTFEAYFIQYMLKGMRRTVLESDLLNTGFAGNIYEEMLDQNLAEEMAHAGGIGLAGMLVDQLADALPERG